MKIKLEKEAEARQNQRRMEKPRLGWLSVGTQYAEDAIAKQMFLEKCADIEWEEIGDGLKWPMMPGMALRAIAEELMWGVVERAGYSNAMAPGELIAVSRSYSNGMVELFCVGMGDRVTPVLAKFYAYVQEGTGLNQEGEGDERNSKR
jgi:hypothetical protein